MKYIPIFAAVTFALAAVALAWLMGKDSLAQAQLAARWTARVGFPIFLIAYTASSLARLWPSPVTRRLLSQRRYWGLGFALSHAVHLMALIHFFRIAQTQPDLFVLIGGGFGYLLITAMALTSSNRAMKWLGYNWKRLHQLGIHTLWAIFTFDYIGRLMDPQHRSIGVLGLALALGALALRIAAIFKKHRTAS
jgi:methionine sulfoxide reductase heme-binding subunit